MKEINLNFEKSTIRVVNINIPTEYYYDDKIKVDEISGTDKCELINFLIDSGLIVTENRQTETLQIKPAKNYNLCIKDIYPSWKTLLITKNITKLVINEKDRKI